MTDFSDNRAISTVQGSALQLHDLGAEPFVTLLVCGHWFALPISTVKDVLRAQPITPVPYAPLPILGITSLQGEPAVVFSVPVKLNLTEAHTAIKRMVAVRYRHELVCIPVEQVGEVLAPMATKLEAETENATWASYSYGVLHLDERRFTVLNLEALFA